MIRPWLPILHSNSGPASGNCWIRRSEGQPAILTARHAVRPKRLGSLRKMPVSDAADKKADNAADGCDGHHTFVHSDPQIVIP